MINLLPETSGYDIDGRPVTAQTGHCPMKKRCPRSCRPNDLQWQLAEVFLVTRNASVLRPRATDASQPHISTVRENVVAVELVGTDIALCAVGPRRAAFVRRQRRRIIRLHATAGSVVCRTVRADRQHGQSERGSVVNAERTEQR